VRAATRHQVPAVKAASPAASLPLAYGGGQVLRNPSVYISYWGGAWPAQAQSYLQTLFTSLGASTWLQPLTQYSDGTGSIANPSTLFQNTHTWVDSTAVPGKITDPDVTAAAGRAASHFGGPAGSLYYVLTPPGQAEAGFGVNWCAWHSNTASPGAPFVYLPYTPDAGAACGLNAVNAGDSFGHGLLDGAGIVAAQELADVVTDPFPATPAWTDANGLEAGDKCEWQIGVPPANSYFGAQFFALPPTWSNADSGCVYSRPIPGSLPSMGRYRPLSPARILDTRPQSQVGPYSTPLGAGQTIPVQVTGQGGVPGSGVAAVVLNLTVVDTTSAGFLTAYPHAQARPLASNLNWSPGETRPNLVTVALGGGGQVDLYNDQGSTDVVADVEGWYTDATVATGSDGLFVARAPCRLLDSRTGNGGLNGPLGQSPFFLTVLSRCGLPADHVGSLILNATVTGATAQSYLTVYPSGPGPRPGTSNVNFVPGQTVPNRVSVPLGADGQVALYNNAGTAQVVIDLNGYYTTAGGAMGSVLMPVSPSRILDSRYGTGDVATLGPGGVAPLRVAGAGGVPANADAAALNLTETNATGGSYVTAFPSGNPPLASDLNFVPGQTSANLDLVQLAGGGIQLFNNAGTVDLIADVAGYFEPAA